MAKAARLLRILDLIQRKRGMTAKRLAELCDVSERTIYRDIQEIGESMKLPIYYENGYRLVSPSGLSQLNLTEEELLLLRFALKSTPLDSKSHFGRLAHGIYQKLGTALEVENIKFATRFEKDIRIEPKVTLKTSHIHRFLKVLEQGIIEKRRILIIGYQSLNRDLPVDRKFDPYGLVFRRHSWYAVGFCHLREKVILLRIDRIGTLRLLNEYFEKPKDFSLDNFFRYSWEVFTGNPVRVMVRFRGRAAKIVQLGHHQTDEKIDPQPDGSVLYSVTVAGTEEILHWILGFGSEAEILQPPELRERVKAIVTDMNKIYGV